MTPQISRVCIVSLWDANNPAFVYFAASDSNLNKIMSAAFAAQKADCVQNEIATEKKKSWWSPLTMCKANTFQVMDAWFLLLLKESHTVQPANPQFILFCASIFPKPMLPRAMVCF